MTRCVLKATAAPEEWEQIRFYNRVRYLPTSIERTRRKLRALEDEARSYGLLDLLERGEC